MDSDEFREHCAGLIDQVIRRLVSLGIDETLLQEEWNAIQTADDDEARFCETAAGLGWDPYALGDGKRDCVLQFAEKLGELLGEAVPAMNTEGPYEDWFAVVDTIAEAKNSTAFLSNVSGPFVMKLARTRKRQYIPGISGTNVRGDCDGTWIWMANRCLPYQNWQRRLAKTPSRSRK